MSTGEPIAIPTPTRERVQKMLEQRSQIDALIEATLLATREALGVPPMYGLSDLNAGFTPPIDADRLTTEPQEG